MRQLHIVPSSSTTTAIAADSEQEKSKNNSFEEVKDSKPQKNKPALQGPSSKQRGGRNSYDVKKSSRGSTDFETDDDGQDGDMDGDGLGSRGGGQCILS